MQSQANERSDLRSSAATVDNEFEDFFLRVLCKGTLKVIYSHCWPNEQVGPKSLAPRLAHDRWTSFSRESYSNMLKFARFFGLQSILRVSLQEKLIGEWQGAIKDKLQSRISDGIPEEKRNGQRFGYLFDFNLFLAFLKRVSQTILCEPVIKMVERMEFSEGLAALRSSTGKQLSFLTLINNYEALRAERSRHDLSKNQAESLKRNLSPPGKLNPLKLSNDYSINSGQASNMHVVSTRHGNSKSISTNSVLQHKSIHTAVNPATGMPSSA